METETKQDYRRRLIIWWSVGGAVFLIIMVLLFWVGFQSGRTTETPPAGPGAAAADQQPDPATANPAASDDPQTESPTTPPVSEQDPEDTTPDDSESAQLQPPNEEAVPSLPANWDQLSSVDKISLNPFDCDPAREEIDLETGLCRTRSTLSSKSRPWNPMALNLAPVTEIEDRPLRITCYDQDLTHLLNQPSDINAASRPAVGVNAEANNDGGNSRHCVLRVVLEMTIDDFYFPNGCRTWRSGFVRLVGAEGNQTKTYDSLSAPGPDIACTKVIVPVAKGQQIEQVFLFEVSASDLNLEITDIEFNLLEPKLTFSGSFGFEIGTESPTSNPR